MYKRQGIASLGQGLLPSEHVIAEHYRLGSTIAILSRSFCNTDKMTDLNEINNPGHIDILAAGTAMRFLTAYLSVTPGTRIITGTQRMQMCIRDRYQVEPSVIWRAFIEDRIRLMVLNLETKKVRQITDGSTCLLYTSRCV